VKLVAIITPAENFIDLAFPNNQNLHEGNINTQLNYPYNQISTETNYANISITQEGK
jgi:hypothetical protein